MQGKLQDESTINVQSLSNGIYYLNVTGKENETVKLIKNWKLQAVEHLHRYRIYFARSNKLDRAFYKALPNDRGFEVSFALSLGNDTFAKAFFVLSLGNDRLFDSVEQQNLTARSIVQPAWK